MQPKQTTSSKLASQYADWIIKWRWFVILSAIVVAIGAASGGRFIAFNNDYKVFFSEANPQLQAFEQVQKTYTKNDNILFAVEAKDGKVFDANTLSAIEELTERAWQLPFSSRVDSVSNFQYTYSEEDDMIVEDLVEGAASLNAEEFSQKQSISLSEPRLRNQLINESASVTGVNVLFNLPQKSLDEIPQAVSAARELAAEIEAKYDVDVYLSGIVMLSNSFFETAMIDMGTLVPIMYLVILLITYALVRSIGGTFAAFMVIMFSVLTGMGLAGFAGIKLTPPSAAATTIIMTLAVADSIHVLMTMVTGMRRGLSKNEAIKESLKANINPVMLTSITTAIGFLSMNFSDSPPFHDLGNITAMGVMGAMVYSLTLLPALMTVLPVHIKKSESKFSTRMEQVGDWVINKQRSILIVSVVVSFALLSFIPKNVLDDNFVSYFDETIDFRVSSDYVNQNLTGIYQIQYSIDSGSSNGVSNPEFLAKLDEFAEWFRTQPEVRHVNSITDTFKQLNKNMHADDEAYYRLPQQQDLAAQYLLLYELSLPYGLDLNNQLNISKSSTLVTVTVEDMGSVGLVDVSERGRAWLEQNMQVESYGVGPAIMFANITERNIKGMLVGTIGALIIISFLIIFALRNVKLGLLSLIPNLLPAGLALGLWGVLVSEINLAVSMVTGMALGIVVDDTIHFLSKYLRAKREHGYNTEQAIRYAFSTVGVAIVVTSIILIAGFSVLAQSAFGMNSNMAILTAMAIGAAVLADFLLLPTLLLKIDNSASEETEAQESKNETQPVVINQLAENSNG